jgi:Tfp pilus assembly protein PilF
LNAARRAESLDPLAVAVAASSGWVLYYCRRFAEAREQLERALAMDEHFATARIPLALSLLQTGAAQDAADHLQRAVIDSGNATSTLALHAHTLVRIGCRNDAEEIMARLDARARETYVSSYYLALPLIAMGDHDAAIARLELALQERAAQMVYIGAEPLLDPLRSSPRFREILRATGLGGE